MLELAVVSIFIPGLLSVQVTKYQKFPNVACNTTVGDATPGVKLTTCLVRLSQNRKKGDQCVSDIQCPETMKCVAGLCDCRWGEESPLVCQRCPPNWIFSSETEKCYLFSTLLKNWTDAEAYCASVGVDNGHLTSISSQTEYSYLANRTEVIAGCWVGASDADQEGVWTWTDGTPFEFEKWNPTDYGTRGPGNLSAGVCK
ncbi:unnamed protein product [Cyprideis torosa]|uniref:Uncharacterized protein n=1 Tax=Cyprideis torosa TaxID=163714 RepID=A0A7R8W653_9CRUS|nr:unnamed protein product [Cyprideis torosa]CAG0882154.1 unnamed protein product [Cyprideis torosa]